ncbi:hypothetical protein NT6N_16210 [Oceaniferula spumae]|uniref:Methyl-accepting transducer domain-containing protein n=1 Tax=Oceaniferula spumae TaxID=2979115 RepID=A0AAT9FKQ7_9BACT
MKNDLPPKITDRLQAILRRVRRLQVSRGILGVLTIFLASVLVVMAVDFFLAPVPPSVRLGLFIAILVVTLVSGWALFWKPLRRKIGLLQIARWLEVRHPEMQERISTAMELAGTSGAGTSASLLNELIAEAEVDVQDLDPQIEVRAQRVKAWLWPTAGLIAVFLLLFIVWPAQTSRLLVRAVAPFSETGNAGAIAFDIRPGDMEVLEDDPVEIKVLYQGSINDTLTLETTHENGEVTEERMAFTGEEDGQHVAVYQLPAASKSFRYRVRAGRDESDAYKVTVWPKPRIAGLEAIYDFPEYTGFARAKNKIQKAGIEAVVGTNIRIEGTANTPVESARFLLDDQEVGSSRIDSRASGGTLNIDFPLSKAQSGVGKIMLKHRLGEEVEVARFPVKALPDEAPKISILTPTQRELKVRRDDQLPITYQVVEHIGLQSVEIDLEINGHRVSPMSQVLPTRIKNSKQALWNGESRIYIGGILERHPKAREVKLRLRVKDNRPSDLGGPGIGESETIVLKISRNAESLVRQELRAQESDIREATEKAKRDIQDAAARMDRQKEKVEKGELDKNTKKDLEKAREKLAEAEEKLEELAERMKNSVHAQKAKTVEKAAEKAKEAREAAETLPLNDTPEARKKDMEKAREAAEKAIEDLDKLQRQMEQDREKVEDLAKLNDLAQKEQELARKAEAQAREEANQPDQENKADDQWKNDQKQVQEDLRREVSERPDAKAEASQQQAEQARELAKEARELGEQQKQLAQQADKNKPDDAEAKQQQDANALQKQLEKEQKKILEEAKEQLAEAQQNQEKRADQLPEAVAEAKKALDELQKDQPKAAAEAAKKAAENLDQLAKPEEQAKGEKADGDENKQAGNEEAQQAGEEKQGDQAAPELKDLAERQEKVAEALEALGEGNNAEAQKALQELQAEAAKELAKDVAAIPDIDGRSPEKNEALDKARQADDHAREAAKQAGEGKQEGAAQRNEAAAEALEKAADALEAEAERLDEQAAEAAKQAKGQQGKQAQQKQAPADGKQLADALQKAAEAAQADNAAEAAEAAKEAAEALDQAAQQAMQNMKSGQQPGQNQGEPKPGEQPGEQMADQPGEKPGEQPQEGDPQSQPDPGVPPELAKLGVSAKDWEKLKTMMKSDVAGSGAAGIPEDYRGLVRKYFQEVAREGKEGN